MKMRSQNWCTIGDMVHLETRNVPAPTPIVFKRPFVGSSSSRSSVEAEVEASDVPPGGRPHDRAPDREEHEASRLSGGLRR